MAAQVPMLSARALHTWLIAALVTAGCVGEELSGGETLSTGGGGGTDTGPGAQTEPTSTDSMSGADPTADSAADCDDYTDPAVAAAHSAMLSDMEALRDRLALEVGQGRAVISEAFGVPNAAALSAEFEASLVGQPQYEASPVLCPGSLPSAQNSAQMCTSTPEVFGHCAGYSDGCNGACEGSLLIEATELACEGTCYGTCSLPVGAGCDGDCVGACDGQCGCESPSGDCEGTCDGTCTGECTAFAGSCGGHCQGLCHVESHFGGPWDRIWCMDCQGEPGDCDGLPLVDVEEPCQSIAGASGLANAQCGAPLLATRLQFGAAVGADLQARKDFRERLRAAEPGFATLIAAVDHVDRFGEVSVPLLCVSGSPSGYAALLDELADIRADAMEFLETVEL